MENKEQLNNLDFIIRYSLNIFPEIWMEKSIS